MEHPQGKVTGPATNFVNFLFSLTGKT